MGRKRDAGKGQTMTTKEKLRGRTLPPFTSQDYSSKYDVVGSRPIRHDGLDKVTGRARYGADHRMPGMLWAQALRSPHAHAKILSIDTREALRVPGVRAVVTAQDVPIVQGQGINWQETLINPRIAAENVLASDKVLHKGHAIAAVAADSPHVAEEAAQKIKVEYEVLPPVLNVHQAMDPDTPPIHETMTTRAQQQRFAKGEDSGVKSNIDSHLQFKRGDLDRGFAEADLVVEREFTTKAVHPGYIEPPAATVYWGADGRVTIWTSTQGHFMIRPVIASILGVDEHAVKIVPMEIGGGFGGKLYMYLEPMCAILSKKTGHPVKMVMSRKDVFFAAGPTSGTYMRARIGVKSSGEITAAHVYFAFEAGAFPGSPVGGAATTSLAPYKIDNLQVDALDVIVNKVKVASYRAPGSTQGALAVETVLDEIAETLGMDPLDLRLKNAAREGDRQPTGVPMPSIGCADVLQAMKEHPHYSAPLEGPNRGRGAAIGFWGNGGGPSTAVLTVNTDGSVGIVTGSVDIGGTRASVAMQAAEVLGISAEDMVPTVGDTDSVGFTSWTGGSRTAFATGFAAIEAAKDIRDQMIGRAAVLWEVSKEDVSFEKGSFINDRDPDERLTFKQLAARMLQTGGPISASASTSAMRTGPAICGNIVDVEVDPETGKVDVLRYTAVQDVGQPAHPSYVEGQMQGGTVQGIGWALTEEYYWTEDGDIANSSFLDYRMPTSLDLPMIDTVLVEVPNPGHPFGLRGVGEVPITPPLASIANAVSHAIGARMRHMPMDPRSILEAIEGRA